MKYYIRPAAMPSRPAGSLFRASSIVRAGMTRHESLRERRTVHRCRRDRAAVYITATTALMTEQVAAEHDAIQNEQLADTVLTKRNTPDTIREWWA